MRHRILIGLLAVGTVVGFGSGFAHMRHMRHGGHDRFMDRVAEECVDAARRLDRGDGRRDGGGDGRRGDWRDDDRGHDRDRGPDSRDSR